MGKSHLSVSWGGSGSDGKDREGRVPLEAVRRFDKKGALAACAEALSLPVSSCTRLFARVATEGTSGTRAVHAELKGAHSLKLLDDGDALLVTGDDGLSSGRPGSLRSPKVDAPRGVSNVAIAVSVVCFLVVAATVLLPADTFFPRGDAAAAHPAGVAVWAPGSAPGAGDDAGAETAWAVPPPGSLAAVNLTTMQSWTASPTARGSLTRRLLSTMCEPREALDVWRVLDEQNGPGFWALLREFQALRVRGMVEVHGDVGDVAVARRVLRRIRGGDSKVHPPTVVARGTLTGHARKTMDPCAVRSGAVVRAEPECAGALTRRDCPVPRASSADAAGAAARAVGAEAPTLSSATDLARLVDFAARNHDLLGANVAVLADDGGLALSLAGARRAAAVTLFSRDPRVVGAAARFALAHPRVNLRVVAADARDPIPHDLARSFDTVFVGAAEPRWATASLRAAGSLMRGVGSALYTYLSHEQEPPSSRAALHTMFRKMGVLVTESRDHFARFPAAASGATCRGSNRAAHHHAERFTAAVVRGEAIALPAAVGPAHGIFVLADPGSRCAARRATPAEDAAHLSSASRSAPSRPVARLSSVAFRTLAARAHRSASVLVSLRGTLLDVPDGTDPSALGVTPAELADLRRPVQVDDGDREVSDGDEGEEGEGEDGRGSDGERGGGSRDADRAGRASGKRGRRQSVRGGEDALDDDLDDDDDDADDMDEIGEDAGEEDGYEEDEESGDMEEDAEWERFGRAYYNNEGEGAYAVD